LVLILQICSFYPLLKKAITLLYLYRSFFVQFSRYRWQVATPNRALSQLVTQFAVPAALCGCCLFNFWLFARLRSRPLTFVNENAGSRIIRGNLPLVGSSFESLGAFMAYAFGKSV
jgi:hypothetical protein